MVFSEDSTKDRFLAISRMVSWAVFIASRLSNWPRLFCWVVWSRTIKPCDAFQQGCRATAKPKAIAVNKAAGAMATNQYLRAVFSMCLTWLVIRFLCMAMVVSSFGGARKKPNRVRAAIRLADECDAAYSNVQSMPSRMRSSQNCS